MILAEPLHEAHKIPEDFVQYLWKNHWFEGIPLKTIQLQSLEIISVGQHNCNGQGADFLDAKIRLDGQLLEGAIEIHKSSSQWYSHGHFLDKRYNNVILQVILEKDVDSGYLTRADGTPLPELHLTPYLQKELKSLWHHYKQIKPPSFPCEPHWHSFSPDQISAVVQFKGESRLYSKSSFFGLGEDWIQQLWVAVMRGLGYVQNATPMQNLAMQIPISTLEGLSSIQKEALLLGTAGLIPNAEAWTNLSKADADYYWELTRKYDQFSHRFQLNQMHHLDWKFGKIRPSNQPLQRIRQAVSLFEKGLLFHQNPLENLLEALYQPDPIAALTALLHHEDMGVGRERAHILLSNALLPSLLFYATTQQEPLLAEYVLSCFAMIKPESNHITALYRHPNWKAKNALESQGLVGLHQDCKAQQCQQCPLGKIALQGTNPL